MGSKTVGERAMTTTISLNLLIDKTTQRVLFAEAGKDFVDFLLSLLALPLSSIVKLITKQEMVGCIDKLYEGVENLSDSYMQPNQDKAVLLHPRTGSPSIFKNLLRLENEAATQSICRDIKNIQPAFGTASKADGVDGFVKGMIIYMITDDLGVTPLSTDAILILMNKFNIKDITSLEEKKVVLGMDEGLELLKASLKSRTVLTDVFLGKQALTSFFHKNQFPSTRLKLRYSRMK